MDRRDPLFLIVDDEPDACWALERILERNHGAPSRLVATAAAALDAARRQAFLLALIDAKLPDLDGLDLARRLRALDAGLKIILVSGYFYHDDATILKALETGLIASFVGKPFQHDEILRAVAEALSAPQETAAVVDSRN